MGKDKPKKYTIDEFKKNFGKNNSIENDIKHQNVKNQENAKTSDMKLFLPSDTLRTINKVQVDNFSLKFNKYPCFDNERFSFYKIEKGKIIYNDFENFPFDKLDFSLLSNNLLFSAKILFQDFCFNENLNIDWRLVIGLGNESVYETSINLHPIYGFPFIPGQAVKGITRSWVIQEYFNSNENDAYKNSTFCHLFGCPKESILNYEFQGYLVFFDAYPIEKPKIKVDVMNPHYGPYYSDNKNSKPPTDYYNPVPIYFITVENTKYQFIISIRSKGNYEGQIGNVQGTLFELCKKFLRDALTQKGIGAKTAVGYGYFK